MSTKVASSIEASHTSVEDITFQPASADIWDKKYRLKRKDGTVIDKTIDETYQRVAKALSEVEETDENRAKWREKFLWALRHGAIPAGRIVSNAGAQEYKPATSTINCTVSGTIQDSMNDILEKVHEAGLTLKAGCVAPGTLVVTEQGLVPVEQAVNEKHKRILSYDKKLARFEFRSIRKHLVTHVPRDENIELVSNGTSLKTSIKHPVLVYRNDALTYVRADEVSRHDALVQHHFQWTADAERSLEAWFCGAHLGDGCAYEKHFEYKESRTLWANKAKAYGKRLIFKIRAAEREVVEKYSRFFEFFSQTTAKVVSTQTPNGTPVWDYAVSSFKASQAAELIDHQIGKKCATMFVPQWIAQCPDKHFLPFLAGLIDTDGTISKEKGSATISCQNHDFVHQLKSMLAYFGVNAGVSYRKPRSHVYNGNVINDSGGAQLKISDSDFLLQVAKYMADSGKRNRIEQFASIAGQYDKYIMTARLKSALQSISAELSHKQRQHFGFYHGYHTADVVSRVWLDRWEQNFPQLKELIQFTRTLRPVDSIKRNLDLSEQFYDFEVDGNNNYLAGNDGLMVIHNCGIGYEFSTLRPHGAFVAGAGAYTSGPLSFMDIYDKMCFTVSSAGGRRGAQMATFDVGHPDVLDFIRAKREDGRLRQFNLSLLITQEFIQAVKDDAQWKLAFPLSQQEVDLDGIDLFDPEKVIWREWPSKKGYISSPEGLVACKVYKTLPARRLWDMIMTSTYDYAEPGFILIDKVNEMNNNWFEEDIRATNPCVTADTWVQTANGPKQVGDLIGTPFTATVDGQLHDSGKEGFFKTATKPVVCLQTAEGHKLRLTSDHRVRRVTAFSRYVTDTEWCEAGKLHKGDRVLLNDHRERAEWQGEYSYEQGYLTGLLMGDGTLKTDAAVLSVWKPAAAVNEIAPRISSGINAVMTEALKCAEHFAHRSDFKGWVDIQGRGEYRMKLAALRDLAFELGMKPGEKQITPRLEQASSDFYTGFLRAFFDADGSVQGNQQKGVSVRLAQSDLPRLESVQRMLLRLGVASVIYKNRRNTDTAMLPDGKGGSNEYPIKPQHELCISGENLLQFNRLVGFADSDKKRRLETALKSYRRSLNRERFVARVESVIADGVEDVYDVQVPGINTFDANGLHAHNCGEQPLPPYGSCLLGSVNLTKFVMDPFTDRARFDWDSYKKTVSIFTRMLDNVVEINGLPLGGQQNEILRKRRHGMGYLGLGSTLTMLCMKYGSQESLEFTERVTRELAVTGWEAGLELAKEKGAAPIMDEEFEVTQAMLRKRPEMERDGYKVGDKIKGKVLHAEYSRYMQRIAEVAPELVEELSDIGCRFTHHSSIAPTGTISLSLANNASNGIEPSFAHHYFRNVIREGKKSKEKIDVYSFELLAYKQLVHDKSTTAASITNKLPDYFITADDITPKAHVDIQAAAQKWIDSSISKTANVPTDYPFGEFKNIYMYAYEQGLKGCTTFRFNPEAFQGVLVKEKDLENTTYRFTLEDGSTVELKGNEEIEYDGEIHTAANLYDALKEGYYGKF